MGTSSTSPLKSAPPPGAAPARGGSTPVPVADVTAAFSSVFVALAAALAVAYAGVPELRWWLGGRSGLVEWITFAALASALGVGIWAMRRTPADSRFRLIIPALATWGLLDELRYLGGLMGMQGLSVDGVDVRSLDDVGTLLSQWSGHLGLGWPMGAAAMCTAGGVTLLAVARTRRWSERLVLVTDHRVVGYILVSIGATVAAPLSGLFGAGDGVAFVGGLLEMTGATLLVVAGLAAGDHRRTVAGWRRRLSPWLSEERPMARSHLGRRPG